jgi:hypothetical protein
LLRLKLLKTVGDGWRRGTVGGRLGDGWGTETVGDGGGDGDGDGDGDGRGGDGLRIGIFTVY